MDGQTRFANASEVSVPVALSGMVLDVRGLDNFRPRPRARIAKPHFTSHQTGNHFLSPGDFATIYNIKPLWDAGLDGTGQTIAVVGQTQIDVSDVDAFRAAAGLPATNLQLVSVDNTSGFSSGDEVEADLDVQWSGGVARNAAILYVYVGANSADNVFDAMEFAIDQNLAPVISTSYGNCEANLSTFTAVLRQDAQQANSQGQTITAAAGDSGAADCENSSAKSATHGLAVDSPASVPEVTALGGSEFTGDSPNSTTSGLTDGPANLPYWSGTTGGVDDISSALIYIPETTWNDTTSGQPLSSTGGGVSTKFAKPAWQNALTPADTHRDVPDVTLSASPAHDSTLICSQGSCVTGFRASDGSLNVVGGTSVGAPAFAGIVAILNQATQSTALDNINPTLYSLAVSNPTAFHDITTGNNIVPCTSGSHQLPGFVRRFPDRFQRGHRLRSGHRPGIRERRCAGDQLADFLRCPGFFGGRHSGHGRRPRPIRHFHDHGFDVQRFQRHRDPDLFTGPAGRGQLAPSSPGSLTATGTSTLTVTTNSNTPAGTTSFHRDRNWRIDRPNASVSLTVSAPDFTISAPAPTPPYYRCRRMSTSTRLFAQPAALPVRWRWPAPGDRRWHSRAPLARSVRTSVANASGTSTLTMRPPRAQPSPAH